MPPSFARITTIITIAASPWMMNWPKSVSASAQRPPAVQ
jgi:hypothetical protein